jgi:hypothetical protein
MRFAGHVVCMENVKGKDLGVDGKMLKWILGK